MSRVDTSSACYNIGDMRKYDVKCIIYVYRIRRTTSQCYMLCLWSGGIFTQLQYSYNYMFKFMIHTTTDNTMLYQICCKLLCRLCSVLPCSIGASLYLLSSICVTAVFSCIPVIRKESYFIIMQLSIVSV